MALTVRSLTCPYCGKQATKATGREIYPHRKDLWDHRFWLCSPCDAYIRRGKKSGIPQGRMANKELRQWKMRAHAAFDPLWKSRKMSRTEAYKWLQEKMELSAEECHMASFDSSQCRRVVQILENEQ